MLLIKKIKIKYKKVGKQVKRPKLRLKKIMGLICLQVKIKLIQEKMFLNLNIIVDFLFYFFILINFMNF